MPFSCTVSPMDYGAVSTILMFAACDIRRCVDVPIVRDTDEEPDEMFGITLERTPGLNDKITLGPVDGDITIIDEGGKSDLLMKEMEKLYYFVTVENIIIKMIIYTVNVITICHSTDPFTLYFLYIYSVFN